MSSLSLLRIDFDTCTDISCPTAALMVGVEICSGINNSMIDKIVSDCAQITFVSDLIQLGIRVHHTHNILSILSHMKKES